MTRVEAPIDDLNVSVFEIPTDAPESDGTFEWTSTTLVVVEASAGGVTGLGYTYADTATAELIRHTLIEIVRGRDAMAVAGAWSAMVTAIRNLGRSGVAAMAIAAVDTALWDLKARLLNVPLVTLLGSVRDRVPVYGSGGFTSYDISRLQRQLGDWADNGFRFVKMKIGRCPSDDIARVRAAREAIGATTSLFVDANGGYTRKQALGMAAAFVPFAVAYFEEPVPSDDLEGLRLLRDRAPAGMDIAAGEYGYSLEYFRRMLEAGAVDILQADATRCAGVTGFMRAGALCEAWSTPLSSHTAPSLHVHVCCALDRVCHLEYFHDHARIEQMLFDGAAEPKRGAIGPDRSRPGFGLELKRVDAARFAA